MFSRLFLVYLQMSTGQQMAPHIYSLQQKLTSLLVGYQVKLLYLSALEFFFSLDFFHHLGY
jgi:hypothetical protein